MNPQEAVGELARRQHGLLTHAQALDLGMTPAQVIHRVRQGTWDRLHRGVFRVAGAPSTYEQRVLAACLATGGVASHRAAARLWEMGGIEPGWAEVTVTTQHLPRASDVTIHRIPDLSDAHTTVRRGLPVTNPMRTLVDLGAVVPRWTVQRAMDDSLSRKLVTMQGLVRIWHDVARPGRAGSGVLRSLIEEHLPYPTASRLEKQMLRLHRRYGLAEPDVEFEIHDDRGRFVARVDFAHPAARVAIETDGFASHSSPAAFQHDRARDRKLHALGWTVLRFTWMEIAYTPRDVAEEIRRFLDPSQSR